MQTPNPTGPETCPSCGKPRVRTLGRVVCLCAALSLPITEAGLEAHPRTPSPGYRAGLHDVLPPSEHVPDNDPVPPPLVRIAVSAVTTAPTTSVGYGPYLLKV
jgi:hypothetical protein